MRGPERKGALALLIPALIILTKSAVFGGEGYRDMTPKQAYKFLTQNRSAVMVDVRSRSEYEFVGHAPHAVNLPLLFWEAGSYNFKPNPDFKKDLSTKFNRDTPLVFICRSGGRSAKAAQTAVALGFKEVFNVLEGFEGEKDSEGHRTVNGWKNANLPYTYNVTDKLRYRPAP